MWRMLCKGNAISNTGIAGVVILRSTYLCCLAAMMMMGLRADVLNACYPATTLQSFWNVKERRSPERCVGCRRSIDGVVELAVDVVVVAVVAVVDGDEGLHRGFPCGLPWERILFFFWRFVSASSNGLKQVGRPGDKPCIKRLWSINGTN